MLRIELEATTLASMVAQIERMLGPVTVQTTQGGNAILRTEGGGDPIPVFRAYSDLYFAVIRVAE